MSVIALNYNFVCYFLFSRQKHDNMARTFIFQSHITFPCAESMLADIPEIISIYIFEAKP